MTVVGIEGCNAKLYLELQTVKKPRRTRGDQGGSPIYVQVNIFENWPLIRRWVAFWVVFGQRWQILSVLLGQANLIHCPTMTGETTYTVEIPNPEGSDSDKMYYVYSAPPEISGKVLPQSSISRIVCRVVSPIEDGDREQFTFIKRYFGFIGLSRVADGKS